MHVPYAVEQDEDGVWCASAQLRPGVGAVGDGPTAEAAVTDLRDALEALLAQFAVDAGSELNRRYPDRVKMRPADAGGFREAWDTLERLWQRTVGRARGMAPESLHERVEGEWTFIETLRHLVFAADAPEDPYDGATVPLSQSRLERRAPFGAPSTRGTGNCHRDVSRSIDPSRVNQRSATIWSELP